MNDKNCDDVASQNCNCANKDVAIIVPCNSVSKAVNHIKKGIEMGDVAPKFWQMIS